MPSQDTTYDEAKVLGKCSRQFFLARQERRQREAAAPEGTMAAAGRVEVPQGVRDGVVWEDPKTRKSYVRVPGFRVCMVFKVLKGTSFRSQSHQKHTTDGFMA